MKNGLKILAPITLVLCLATLYSCGRSGVSDNTTSAAGNLRLPDTLKVVTLYSPEAYFIYKGQEMGYDYELVTSLAVDKNIALKMEIAPTLSRAVEMLDSGLVDLIAYEVPITAEYKDKVVACGPETVTTQVLVQPK